MDPLQTPQPKRFSKLRLLVVIIIIALVALVWAGYNPFPNFFKSDPAPYSKVVPKLSEESLTKVPLLFPKQFILGQAPVVLNATERVEATSTVSIVLIFKDTNNSLEALATEYVDYANRANWSVIRNNESSGDALLEIKRGFQEMTIRIKPNAQEGGVLVNINYYVKTI